MRKPDRFDFASWYVGLPPLIYIDGKTEFKYLAFLGVLLTFSGLVVFGIATLLVTSVLYYYENHVTTPEVPNSYLDPKFKPFFQRPVPGQVSKKPKDNYFTARVSQNDARMLVFIFCFIGASFLLGHDWISGVSDKNCYLIGVTSVLLGFLIRVQYN